MRLTEDQRAIIRDAVQRTLGNGARVWLFGSRVDDEAKGGDIDLYVEVEGSASDALERQIQLYAALQRALGMQRIDVVVHRQGEPKRPIDVEARRTGVRL
ncbi:MAG: nucleotidyltransferase domain-containing protein [Chromatiaceae bacterium]|jgi:predicted nucleotidyltransferase|nr:nucleotidyltransferase domain-containing protein [Chromatiaceae bacterium]